MPKADYGVSALASLLDGSTAGELIPELARHGLQQLIELEVAALLAADRHERTEELLGYRTGSRSRLLTTQVGDIPLAIPQLRAGSFFPTILESRRRIDQAFYAAGLIQSLNLGWAGASAWPSPAVPGCRAPQSACRSGSTGIQPAAAGSAPRFAVWPSLRRHCLGSGGHPRGAGCRESSASL
jgi:hypothetical protein